MTPNARGSRVRHTPVTCAPWARVKQRHTGSGCCPFYGPNLTARIPWSSFRARAVLGKQDMSFAGRFSVLFLIAGTSAVAIPAHADAPPADVARLAAAGHALKWNWVPPGRSARYGHAETL